jgi:hypothetical protein
MPQQRLDVPKIGPPLQQMSGKAVPQAMQGYVLLNTGLLQCPQEYFPETGGAVPAALGAFKKPLLWAVLPIIHPQKFQRLLRQQRNPILFTFGITNNDTISL